MADDSISQPRARARAIFSSCTSWFTKKFNKSRKTSLENQVQLSSLTPHFKTDQHQSYLTHLTTALNDNEIHNIALTGRYGAGKSSILKEFARQNERRVLFLTLSTLGPEDPNETKTNQIEKELVKQLLHQEKPTQLPQSRYQRIDRLPTWRAIAQSTATLATIGIALWLFGVTPRVPGLQANLPAWIKISAGALVATSSVWLLAKIRLAVHNRFVVSQVSAAGAAITLTNKSETYFDKYLDEIVYFFESRPQINVVIFEDLDRFNHAAIFEALRELNTILNNSKQVTGRPFRRSHKRSIRFIYALRDSIFEQLGHDSKKLQDDAAQAEAVRANRTKFFDLVIPLVPFITHRTARNLLGNVLADHDHASVPQVSNELIDLVARHIPDMRSLTNIRNEYFIFAKRLIVDNHGMDTLTADQLFALVVYKNLHLEDFEYMLLGRSKLDAVYQLSRDLVTDNIVKRRARLRKINDGLTLQDMLEERASSWGQKLEWFFNKVSQGALNGFISAYTIGGNQYENSAVTTPDFWQKALESGTGVGANVYSRTYQRTQTVSLDMDELETLVSEGLRINDWTSATQDQLLQKKEQILDELRALRVADFVDLCKNPTFTVAHEGKEANFRTLIASHVNSELGQALIAEGYIDRYYNMYAAQYYGERVPTNTMSFIVQNVDTNTPDIYYPFNHEGEIAALLRETKRSFLSDISAYNIGILDFLLQDGDDGAHVVLQNVIRHVGKEEREFLDAYLSEGTQAGKAVAYFATQWPNLFNELVNVADLAYLRRIQLVDVALANSSKDVEYLIDDVIRQFLRDNYRHFYTIASSDDTVESPAAISEQTTPPTQVEIINAVNTLARAEIECEDLAVVREAALKFVIESDCYALTAENLRVALGHPTSLSLDRIRDRNTMVYEDALARPDDYLRAIDSERRVQDTSANQGRTHWTIENPDTFTSIVGDLAELKSREASSIIRLTNPDCVVDELSTVPKRIWEVLAECERFPATLENVDVYIEYLGEVDTRLGKVLSAIETIELPTPSTHNTPASPADANTEDATEADEIEAAKLRVAEAILNASAAIPDPRKRTQLVGSLHLESWFPVSKVPAESGLLLGNIIENRICEDAATTFAHFDMTDWQTLHFGIKQSRNFADFVTPALLNPPATKRILDSVDLNVNVKRAILERFNEFVPVDSRATLAAAARAALANSIRLDATQIASIAQGTGNGDLVVRLANRFRTTLTPEQILAALLQAGEPYRRLATTGEKLSFPRDDHHEGVLQRLKASGHINSRAYAKSLLKDARIEVEVL